MTKYKKVLPDDKNQIVYLYRSRLSMKVISEMTGISKTKIHDILHEADSKDGQIFLCHDLRLRLHKEGITLRDYADLIRAKNIFSNEANSRNVLAITREASNVCFRMGLDIQTLVSFFGNFSQFVYSMTDKFPENFGTKLESELNYLETKVNDLDTTLAKCGQLYAAIDLIEKMVSRLSNSTGKR